MSSTRETALAALKEALDTIAGVTVERNTDVFAIDWGDKTEVLVLRDGDPGEPEVVMSPLTYYYEHVAELEVLVQGDDATRDSTWDTLLGKISTAINADTTLGGAVTVALLGQPYDAGVEPEEGATGIKGGIVPITLYYDTQDPLN